MRASQFLIATVKEIPSDAEVISHQLMLRAGLIRKLASGLYTWLPMGLRVLRKVEAIIRKEMNNAGAQELSMPVVQPAELWQESGRWSKYGAELLRISDRHNRSFCLGPTHEEVVTDLIRNEINSYKQLPANFYQIQTKFRDEIRPRFGIMRAREFLMKDAYSFHIDQNSLNETYQLMHQTYSNIFTRLGLDFRSVLADTGSIGGNVSHEFHVLASSGEDSIAFSDSSDYAANVEMAEAAAPKIGKKSPSAELQEESTLDQHTIEEVAAFFNIQTSQILKTLIVHGAEEGQLIALVLRGDHQLNEIKAGKKSLIAEPLTMATEEEIEKAIGCRPGSIGPVDLNLPTLVDRTAAQATDFVCGCNKDGYHFTGANWLRDASFSEIADLRKVTEGDPSPDGKGMLQIKRGIEVGHIFQLGKTYSESLKAEVLNDQGKSIAVTMGCYGIGVSRVIAAAIEQNHDGQGIIWPDNIAPFQVAIVPLNMHKSKLVTARAELLYAELKTAGYDVLLDDRNKRPGIKFADMDLVGIPHRIIIGERSLEAGNLEYKGRREADTSNIPIESILEFINSKVSIK